MQPTAAKLSEAGLTKCWVLWENGAKKAFRSYDTSGRYQVTDPKAYGIRGLKKMVNRWGGSVKKAIIYDMGTQQPIEKFENGQWVGAQA